MILSDKIKASIPLDLIEVDTEHPLWNLSQTLDKGSGEMISRLTYGTEKETRTKCLPHVSKSNTVHTGINYIKVDYAHPYGPQVVIVVTGKVLDNPAQLISHESIREVWDKINATGLLYGYAPEVLPRAQWLGGDLTRDIITEFDPAEYVDLVNRYYVGKKFVRARDYSPNIQLQHSAKSKEFSRTLTLYNKNLESKSELFATNTLRSELRANSFEMLRKYLKQPPGPVMLMKALESTADPINAVFDEVMKDIKLSNAIKNMNKTDTIIPHESRVALFAAKELSFDDKAIFARLKELAFNVDPLRAELKGDKNSGRKLAPYLEIYTKWQAFTAESSHDVALLSELLDKIKNPQLHKRINQTISDYAQAA